MNHQTPNPGSAEAVEAGCVCPILDNAHGRGYMGQAGIFVMRGNCPLHNAAMPSHCQSTKSLMPMTRDEQYEEAANRG